MRKDRHSVDIDGILNKVLKRNSVSLADKNVIIYSKQLEDEGLIKKLAFDVYRVDNDPYEGLWLLEDIEGVPHLVRASQPEIEQSKVGDWIVTSDQQKENVTLSYKSFPIARFSSVEYGFGKEDILTFKSAILDRISNDKTFVKEVLAEQAGENLEALVKTFPEIKTFIF